VKDWEAQGTTLLTFWLGQSGARAIPGQEERYEGGTFVEVRLIAVTNYVDGDTSQDLLEHAGRVCYRSTRTGDAGKFLQSRIREGHESIIEHASATFEISGISRACSHQVVRHRLASYSQESQRYVSMTDPEFVVPPDIAANLRAMEVWQGVVDEIREAYQELRRLGIRKEDARFLLPNATATRIVMSANFREYRHFIKLRSDPAAQWEIRELASRFLDALYEVAPAVFSDLVDARTTTSS
jgi:thymidylate synthase (FAD)